MILRGSDIGIELPGTGNIIGWVLTPSDIVVMPGESKSIIGQIQILDDYKESFRGKTIPLNFIVDTTGSCKTHRVQLEITLPTQ